MPRNELGDIRRSQIIQYGPGAIVDFRVGEEGGGPVSIMTSGLEFWEKSARVFELSNDPNIIRDPRLEVKLNKAYFRLAPAKNEDEDRYCPHIQGVRFPTWLSCPECGSLDKEYRFDKEMGDPSRWCQSCSNKKGRRVYAVPARFVVTCRKGHISDFPWPFYLQRISKSDICADGKCNLFLRSDGQSSGLESLILSCVRCHARCSLSGIFSFHIQKCQGHRPWIGDKEECDLPASIVKRESSNIYFPVIESSLSIPPWDDPLEKSLNLDWRRFLNLSDTTFREVIAALSLHLQDISESDLFRLAKRRIRYKNSQNYEKLRPDEYEHFIQSSKISYSHDSEFKVTPQDIDPAVQHFLSHIVKVERVKEVRVQTGFTRLSPPHFSKTNDKDIGGLSSDLDINWLPAVEIRGEGIFFAFDDNCIKQWLNRVPFIYERYRKIQEEFTAKFGASGDSYHDNAFQFHPVFLLLHTLSHVMIRQLSLLSGYNMAAIRERIYFEEGAPGMCGVLIYTGSSDSDGTLGGLARLSETDLFANILKGAIQGAEWCSSDPLCIGGITSLSEAMNVAACHSCIFLPETSCEHFNRFLDRALLVGTPENPEMGFFSDVLES